MSERTVLAIDLAKNVFQVHTAKLQRTLRRGQVLRFVAQQPPCVVAMEACSSAHYWAREFRKLGHAVMLIPPQYVKPFRRGNKTDRNDAAAIWEAAHRPKLRCVAVKSEEQQALMAAQRLRHQLVKARTALTNHVRGELAEFGVSVIKGHAGLRRTLADTALMERLPGMMREALAQIAQELLRLEEAIKQATGRLESFAQSDATCRALRRRCGIGVLTAIALVAQIDPTQFKNGRHLSAYLGLTPREHSSGDRQVLLGISKRGNVMLRTLLIHGARAVVRTSPGKSDPLSRWIAQLLARRGKHKTFVAVANKLARYAWADLMQARQLEPAAH